VTEIIVKRRIIVDDEIADEIRWLNEQGVYTEGSCSGHGKERPTAAIKPSSRSRAEELGYEPIYKPHTALFEIELQGEKFDCCFDIALDDGRIARCWEAQRQPYSDSVLSSGLVENIDPDVFYLRLERNGEEPLTLFLRQDEMQAIAWLCNGALWAKEVLK
jgi:hypothetical protein